MPEDIDLVTTLAGLSTVLPSIFKGPVNGIDGTLPPEPDEVREEYLRTLQELVMAKAKPDHAPPSLLAEYESLLKLTDGLQHRDILNERICEVGVILNGADLERSVPEVQEFEEFVDRDISAGHSHQTTGTSFNALDDTMQAQADALSRISADLEIIRKINAANATQLTTTSLSIQPLKPTLQTLESVTNSRFKDFRVK
ncbi:hypothetical protein F4782DRAFT_531553 [Xylaria castorea]|nr:hypothetical protein F4782DRAFT_531553 [Xylaria castorea]